MIYTNVYLGMFYLPLEKWISKHLDILCKFDLIDMVKSRFYFNQIFRNSNFGFGNFIKTFLFVTILII